MLKVPTPNFDSLFYNILKYKLHLLIQSLTLVNQAVLFRQVFDRVCCLIPVISHHVDDDIGCLNHHIGLC